jgi:hypothetical protein
MQIGQASHSIVSDGFSILILIVNAHYKIVINKPTKSFQNRPNKTATKIDQTKQQVSSFCSDFIITKKHSKQHRTAPKPAKPFLLVNVTLQTKPKSPKN